MNNDQLVTDSITKKLPSKKHNIKIVDITYNKIILLGEEKYQVEIYELANKIAQQNYKSIHSYEIIYIKNSIQITYHLTNK